MDRFKKQKFPKVEILCVKKKICIDTNQSFSGAETSNLFKKFVVHKIYTFSVAGAL